MNKKLRERITRFLTVDKQLNELGYYSTGYDFKTRKTRFCTGFDPKTETWDPIALKRIALVDEFGNIEYIN